MASPSTGVRSSKRKRAQVKYYESETSDHGDESCDDFISTDESPQAKKRKPKSFKKPQPKQKAFPFRLLPAELRNKIYQLALTDCVSIKIRCWRKSHRKKAIRAMDYDEFGNTANKLLYSNLLCLSKQTLSEAQAFLYGSNSFLFEDTFSLYTFLASIGTRNVGLLTHLILPKLGTGERAHNAMDNPAMTLLVSAVDLNILDFQSAMRQWFYNADIYEMPDGVPRLRENAKTFYRMAHHWLRARGEAALRAIHFSNLYPCNTGDCHEQSKLGTEQVFKDELRRLMKK
ncbi:MAG: hypothetical protein OHK93_008412 [Ramalina farinacea]|uniref:Uncharacterized protein n=1 Tax=Ramalina farinacea TaxID=258253 RepID=A0AA43TV94_9LECA|nr:hypothetical protein [Ramalina farinacea]